MWSRHLQRTTWLVALGLGIASPCAAWNDTGHLVIALAAYDAMPAPTQRRLAAIVAAHPRFEPDFVARRPRWVDTVDGVARDRWYVAFASTWPDVAREFAHVADPAQRTPLVRLYHRGPWHYVNLPTYLSDADRHRLDVREPPLAADDGAQANVVQVLKQLCARWNEDIDDAERALVLAWLLHLIADVHQPLHATALFATGRLAQGDRGGNLLRVGERDNLHRIWDGALGASRRRADLERAAAALAFDRAVTTTASFDFAAWARGSRDVARRVVYTPAILAAVAAQRDAQDVRIDIDSHYRAAVRRTSREGAALAAQRSAALLTQLVAADFH